MPTLLIMEFSSAIAGRGVYPVGYSGNTLDFSTGTVRSMDLNDGGTYFNDNQQSSASDQTLASNFTYSGGTISAGTIITSAGQTQLVSSDGLSIINVGYVRIGSGADIKQLLIIEVVSGPFDPSATYNSSASTDANGGFVYACFLPQAKILTSLGEVAIQYLKIGDLVVTQDHGLQPIRWIGSQKVPPQVLADHPNLTPVRIKANSMGLGLPHCDLLVSPQHRVLVRSKIVQKMTGASEALVAAKHLTELDEIEHIDCTNVKVEYFHFLLDRHEIVFADGLPVESLFTGPQALKSVGEDARNEILFLFPSLRNNTQPVSTPARVFMSGPQGRKLVFRHIKNNKALLQDRPSAPVPVGNNFTAPHLPPEAIETNSAIF